MCTQNTCRVFPLAVYALGCVCASCVVVLPLSLLLTACLCIALCTMSSEACSSTLSLAFDLARIRRRRFHKKLLHRWCSSGWSPTMHYGHSSRRFCSCCHSGEFYGCDDCAFVVQCTSLMVSLRAFVPVVRREQWAMSFVSICLLRKGLPAAARCAVQCFVGSFVFDPLTLLVPLLSAKFSQWAW